MANPILDFFAKNYKLTIFLIIVIGIRICLKNNDRISSMFRLLIFSIVVTLIRRFRRLERGQGNIIQKCEEHNQILLTTDKNIMNTIDKNMTSSIDKNFRENVNETFVDAVNQNVKNSIDRNIKNMVDEKFKKSVVDTVNEGFDNEFKTYLRMMVKNVIYEQFYILSDNLRINTNRINAMNQKLNNNFNQVKYQIDNTNRNINQKFDDLKWHIRNKPNTSINKR